MKIVKKRSLSFTDDGLLIILFAKSSSKTDYYDYNEPFIIIIDLSWWTVLLIKESRFPLSSKVREVF